MSISQNVMAIREALPGHVTLVAISKTHPPEAVMEAYHAGQRVFGENKVQELVAKYEALPKDIEWHLVGHLQSNKVKYIAPFVSLIHSVDSLKLLKDIGKGATGHGRVIDCLLQVYIAEEDTKFGLAEAELEELLQQVHATPIPGVRIVGLMGMATFTDNMNQVRREFRHLYEIFSRAKSFHFENDPSFSTLSMGMSGDYLLAVQEGATMVRIGSSIFGARHYPSL